MDALTQAEVFALIGELNGFIEKWDPRLVTQEREYQAKRTRIIAENNAEKTRREKAYKQECETLSRQSAKMIEDAQKILEDVDQMDQQLMSSDKYYSKTKTRKEAELAGVESQAYRNYTALMEGMSITAPSVIIDQEEQMLTSLWRKPQVGGYLITKRSKCCSLISLFYCTSLQNMVYKLYETLVRMNAPPFTDVKKARCLP